MLQGQNFIHDDSRNVRFYIVVTDLLLKGICQRLILFYVIVERFDCNYLLDLNVQIKQQLKHVQNYEKNL